MVWSSRAMLSGLIGACAVTLLNETARRTVPEAPRLDVLGRRAIGKTMLALDRRPPLGPRLEAAALGGDLVANSLYYSAVGVAGREHALATGAALGLVAGLGAVALPEPMGLGDKPTGRSAATAAMSIAWYLLGGLAAGAAYRMLASDEA